MVNIARKKKDRTKLIRRDGNGLYGPLPSHCLPNGGINGRVDKHCITSYKNDIYVIYLTIQTNRMNKEFK